MRWCSVVINGEDSGAILPLTHYVTLGKLLSLSVPHSFLGKMR